MLLLGPRSSISLACFNGKRKDNYLVVDSGLIIPFCP
jgi:hypothetical protein